MRLAAPFTALATATLLLAGCDTMAPTTTATVDLAECQRLAVIANDSANASQTDRLNARQELVGMGCPLAA